MRALPVPWESVLLSHDLPQFSVVIGPLYWRLLVLLDLLLFLLTNVSHKSFAECPSVIVQPVHLTMPPHALLVPTDLPTVCLSMFLRVELRRAYRCPGIYEEKASHGKGR